MKYFVIFLIGIAILPLLVQSVHSLELDTSSYSLKQQIKEGWDIESLFCHNDQVLILKITDESPACVNPETKEKLLERGWAILTPKERLYDIEKTLNDNDCLEFGRWLDEFVDGNFNENNLIFDLPISDELSQRIYDSIPDCVYHDSGGFFKLNTKHFIDFEKLKKPDSKPEPPFEKEEPFTKIEVMFGEKLNDGLVPVTFTEVITHAETLDEIMVWNFELIGHSGDDRRVIWDTLPKDKRIWYEITDDNGQDIRIPENIVVPADLHGYEMDCGFFHIVTGESAHPTLLLIKNNTSSIFVKNSGIGIYPDSNGDYSFEFASIFEHYVRFPEDIAEIISQESKHCKLTHNIEDDPTGKYTDGYYTKMVFRLE